jgi:hypothetical protein
MIATIPDAAAALIRTAKTFDGVLEVPANSNSGVVPDFCNWYVIRDWRQYPMGGCGANWCATFALTMGRLAVGDAWPIPIEPMFSDVDQIVGWAKVNHVFHKTPEDGDLIVLYYPQKEQWGHVGIVTLVLSNERVKTIEGNTNAAGSRQGGGVHELVRSVNSLSAFVRWVNALP